jgi:signal transduction histidine kinase/ligand-binding sensor domain-containing protein/ActR/RegA family two-component response regulator
MTRGGSIGAAVAIALAFAITAAAQEYSFRHYGLAEGFQNLAVLSLAQDHAGYIWAGTEGGLYRYDGTRFRLMGQAEGLPCSTEVHGLFVASDGALWANTCAGIFRFDGRRFLSIPGVDRLLRGAQVMADAAGGGVLITTSAGLYEASPRSDGSFSTHSFPMPAALAGKPMHSILRQGPRVWFGCDQQLCMEQAGQVSVFGRDQGLPEEVWDGIQISPDGSVWVRSPKCVYRRAPGETRFSQEKPDIASSGFWGALTMGRDGSIMVPNDKGLAIYTKGQWSVVNRKRGLRNENATAVLEDHEGSVWIGLAGGGVARWIGRGVWESWTMSDGLPSDIVWNIRRDRKGALWVGTALGLTRIDGSGQTRTWTKKDGLGGRNVRWLAETSDGSIWAAMKPGGLARIDPVSGKIRLAGPKDGLHCDPEDLFVDRHDRLWLPTRCGLFLNEQPSVSNQVIRVETPESFGPSAWKVMEDARGTIWVTNQTGLWSLREGQWRQHRRTEGLLTDHPYMMVLAGDGSLWLRRRYDAGIDRLEVSGDRIVRATAVVPGDSKTPEGTAFHGFDAFGNFWRGSTNGVTVLHGNTWTKFTVEDGLVSNDCNGEAFWADTDGGVWLGTSGGLAHYRSGNGGPPGPPIAYPTIARLEINQQARLIRVEFSSLNYKAEQLVQFAYRLDQAPWIDSVERTISISGLGPGRHRLELRSRVRDGPFSAKIAAAEFRLEPIWTETWWARLLAVACALGAIIQFVRWRLSAAVKKQAELEAIVAARTKNLREANRSLDDKARRLRRSEDLLKNAERLAHVGHWDWDVRADQLSWSEEMFRIFDVPRDYTPSYKGFVGAVVRQDRERLEQWVAECLAKKSGHSIEFQIAQPNGDLRIVCCTSEVLLDEEGLPARMFGACQDITDSRRAQQEDFARKKLESVGILAGGIAHDFNNLLGGVLAQADLALVESASGSYPEEELKAIRNVAIRGSEIVRQLMIYAGKESEALELVNVSRIVVEMLELLKVSVSKRIKLLTALDQDPPPVRASAAQIRQIVMNLVTNASEAIGDRDGVIRVTTGRVTPGRAATIAKGLDDAGYLQLEVTDSGCGISQEAQASVFDPFFSTKGAGHGLGLAAVHGIVRSLHGTIHIASELDHGTTFQILLPCAETTAEAILDPKSDADQSVRPSQEFIVLVVEDEDLLREAVVRMLRKKGFAVLEAADGAAAIDLLRTDGSKIDVILLDMTIPRASSQEVVAQAAQVRPNIRVILTSAYSQEMLTPFMTVSQIHDFIRKPYQLRDLVQVLRKASGS